MKSQLKRVVALVLTFSMALGLLQVNAFADAALTLDSITAIEAEPFVYNGKKQVPEIEDVKLIATDKEVSLDDLKADIKAEDIDIIVDSGADPVNATLQADGETAVASKSPIQVKLVDSNGNTSSAPISGYDIQQLSVEDTVLTITPNSATYKKEGSAAKQDFTVSVADKNGNVIPATEYELHGTKEESTNVGKKFGWKTEPKAGDVDVIAQASVVNWDKKTNPDKPAVVAWEAELHPAAGKTNLVAAAKGKEVEGKVTINPDTVSDWTITGVKDSYPYIGKPYEVKTGSSSSAKPEEIYIKVEEPTAKGKNDLATTTDFTADIKNGTDAGTADIAVTGVDNYDGVIHKTFTIEKAKINDTSLASTNAATVLSSSLKQSTNARYKATNASGGFLWNKGQEVKPVVTGLVGVGNDTALKEGEDYTVSYVNNCDTVKSSTAKEEDKAYVVVTGIGNYTGEIKVPFDIVGEDSFTDTDLTITAPNLRDPSKTVKLEAGEKETDNNYHYTFDGTAKKPELTIKKGNKTLVEGTDYELVYTDAKGLPTTVRPGTAVVTIKGINSYGGSSAEVKFTIDKTANVPMADVTAEDGRSVYTGNVVTPELKVTYKDDVLVNGDDYIVTKTVDSTGKDAQLKDAGTYTLTLTALNSSPYTGTKEVKYVIAPTIANATVADIPDVELVEGEGNKAEPKVTVTLDGKTLTEGVDYTLSYKDNDKVGTGTVTITGIGDYAGTIDKTFKIVAGTKKLDAPVLTAFGKNSNKANGINIQWSTVEGADGYIVYRKAAGDDDYTQLCKREADAYSNAGAGKQVNDTHVNGEHGTLYTYKVVAYKGEEVGEDSNAEEVIRMDPVTLKASALKTKGALNATWSRAKNGTGYLLQTSTSSDFKTGTKNRYVYGAKNVSWIRSQLKSGKNYVRVRVIRNYTAGEQWYYSAWSNVVPVNVR